MPRSQLFIDIPALGSIDPARGRIGQQLAKAIRNAISSGQLTSHDRLPSSRLLAHSLGISRGTVTEAYEQLIAEGWLVAHRGSSTRVASGLGESHVPAQPLPKKESHASPDSPLPGDCYAPIAEMLRPLGSIPFSVAIPEGDVAMGPHWRRLSSRVLASVTSAPSGYADPQGLYALRQSICQYLRKSRAVHCEPANILITEGSQQGLYLAAKVLLAPGDSVWVEDPAYRGMTAVLDDRGVRRHGIRVDSQGFDVGSAVQAAPEAKAAFVTPLAPVPDGYAA